MLSGFVHASLSVSECLLFVPAVRLREQKEPLTRELVRCMCEAHSLCQV